MKNQTSDVLCLSAVYDITVWVSKSTRVKQRPIVIDEYNTVQTYWWVRRMFCISKRLNIVTCLFLGVEWHVCDVMPVFLTQPYCCCCCRLATSAAINFSSCIMFTSNMKCFVQLNKHAVVNLSISINALRHFERLYWRIYEDIINNILLFINYSAAAWQDAAVRRRQYRYSAVPSQTHYLEQV